MKIVIGESTPPANEEIMPANTAAIKSDMTHGEVWRACTAMHTFWPGILLYVPFRGNQHVWAGQWFLYSGADPWTQLEGYRYPTGYLQQHGGGYCSIRRCPAWTQVFRPEFLPWETIRTGYCWPGMSTRASSWIVEDALTFILTLIWCCRCNRHHFGTTVFKCCI